MKLAVVVYVILRELQGSRPYISIFDATTMLQRPCGHLRQSVVQVILCEIPGHEEPHTHTEKAASAGRIPLS